MIAALSAWHESHEVASAALAEVHALPAHVVLEAYSVLTRLPSGLAVQPQSAATLLAQRFERAPLTLTPRRRRDLLPGFAAAAIHGGAVYDGLVGLEAHTHDETLLTLDQRASVTYRRLGVDFRALT